MAVKITDNDKKTFQSWKADWNIAARDLMGCRLATWQQEGLHLIQHNKRVSFCTATSFGKDYLMSLASWLFFLLVPEIDANGIIQTATVINTAPTGRQVNKIMMPELKKRFYSSKLPAFIKHGIYNFHINQNGVVTDLHKSLEGNKKYSNYPSWRIDAFKADEYNTEAWTGYHNENIMVAVTEASGMPQLIWDGVEGCLQNNSKLLLAFNANNTTGEAYNSTKDKQYKFKRYSAFDGDNFQLGKKLHHGEITKEEYDKLKFPGQLDFQWVKDHVEKPGWTVKIDESEKDTSKHDFEFEGQWYRPTDVCKIKILAQHPESSEDTLIPLSWIEAAQERWLQHKRPNGRCIRAVDIAGMGKDTNTFVDRFGDYVDNIRTIACSDKHTVHMEIAGKLVIEKDKTDVIIIDAIGEGAGVYSRLKEQTLGHLRVLPFKNSYGVKNLTDKTGERRFVNMRAYTHWAIRDWLDPQYNSTAMLPPDDELKAQLAEIKYKVLSNGFIQIESKDDIKKRLGVSPDKADGLFQTAAPIELMQGYDNSETESVSGSEIIF